MSTVCVDEMLERVNRTISPSDVIFPGFEAIGPGVYFTAAARQLDEIDARLREHQHPGLARCSAVADYAPHYGRMTRVLRAAIPQAAVYACDIDEDAVRFCADELGALPVVTGWRPDEDALPEGLDAVVCVSLLTHTTLEHWRRTLRAWARMLRPGGIAAFTYLDQARTGAWLAGQMPHYGTYTDEARDAAVRAVRDEGFGFAALPGAYGSEPSYGVTFVTREVVQREIIAAGLELIALPAESSAVFGQELALARRPSAGDPLAPAAPALRRDVAVVALYDPRGYAPAEAHEGDPAESIWAQLTAADSPRPLPTDLSFADPRVPEVREEQAVLAREHGVDAFCYLAPWGTGGPRWDAPLRDMLATGRPDFPFCVMVAVDDAAMLAAEAGERIVDALAPALRDRRYLRVDERALIVVRNLTAFADPPATAAALRFGAAARGLGDVHLCAVQSAYGESPTQFGFDSFVQAPSNRVAGDPVEAIAEALTAPWPPYRLFRIVECRRDDVDPHPAASFEHWLHGVLQATRRYGESLVFVDAWNDWPRGRYLEPDDRDGRAMLQATRRAARGPSGAFALARRLRDALGDLGEAAEATLAELETVLSAKEHTRERLLASVEAAHGRSQLASKTPLRWVPASSRQLPPSGGHYNLDAIAPGASPLGAPAGPVPLEGGEARFTGWAHPADGTPDTTDFYLALEAVDGAEDRVFRGVNRILRPDVPVAFPHYAARCGFDVTVALDDVPGGTYHVAVVQRTQRGTYRDATGIFVKREQRDV